MNNYYKYTNFIKKNKKIIYTLNIKKLTKKIYLDRYMMLN